MKLQLALLAAGLAASPSAQVNDEAVLAWMREEATSIGLHEDGALSEAIVDIVGDARIVALGEATHGSRESFLWRRLALRTLVQELGFDASSESA